MNWIIIILYITGAHGATDVTGFGILGHVQNLARAQKELVSFVIHSLPSKLIAVSAGGIWVPN